MAKTKQTAKKSTGGKAPRKTLANNAVRYTVEKSAEHWLISGEDEGRSFAHIEYAGAIQFGQRTWWVRRLKQDGTPYRQEMTIDDDDVKLYFGQAIHNWCVKRKRVRLDVNTAHRWGLTEALAVQNEDEEADEDENGGESMTIPVDKVFYNPLRKDELSTDLPRGLRYSDLQPGCFYASINGKDAEWHLILLYSIEIKNAPSLKKKVDEPPLAGDYFDEESDVSDFEPIELSIVEDLDKKLDKLHDWCLRLPGRVYAIEGPGWRPQSDRNRDFYALDKRILAVSAEYECAHSSVVNGIFTLGNEALARKFAHISETPSVRGLKDLSKWIENKVKTYRLRHEVSAHFRSAKYILVPRPIPEIVYLFRLTTANRVNHIICVDCSKKLIYDCMEKHPLHLDWHALEGCAGPDAQIEQVDIWKLEKISDADHVGEDRSKRKLGKSQKRRRNRAIKNEIESAKRIKTEEEQVEQLPIFE